MKQNGKKAKIILLLRPPVSLGVNPGVLSAALSPIALRPRAGDVSLVDGSSLLEPRPVGDAKNLGVRAVMALAPFSINLNTCRSAGVCCCANSSSDRRRSARLVRPQRRLPQPLRIRRGTARAAGSRNGSRALSANGRSCSFRRCRCSARSRLAMRRLATRRRKFGRVFPWLGSNRLGLSR